MSTIRISLVIPCYNRGELIAETIESALAQTIPFHEIIVVDDGSTDNTQAVLSRYRDRIRSIVLENGGVQRARNAGDAAARGSHIALCDSDDLLEADFVASTTAWLETHPDIDALYCNFRTFDEQGIQLDKFKTAPPEFFMDVRYDGAFCFDIEDLYARLMRYQPLFPTGAVFRKTFFDAIGGYDPRFKGVGSEDLEFTLRVIDKGRVALCTRPLARVRKHDGNISATPMRQVKGEIEILEFALQRHDAAQRYRDEVRSSLRRRRIDLFNAAFSHGDFDVAASTLSRLDDLPDDRKFRMKKLITNLPELVRTPLWRVSQM
ncbi:glycosyltransferase family 2 protein [Massilia sp. 9096]|uniref:glycosyltransferase family 2 protein n=1 Tax=Massilia sp. 9096 TaxID=1500894 RepID=UPI0005683B50|nr:glycosyltransferase family 2 protein [Massilia sp. 9096]